MEDNQKPSEQMQESVEHVHNKLHMLHRLQETLDVLDEYAKVYVYDPPDSHYIEVSVEADSPTEELILVSRIRNGNGEIIYDPEEKVYKVDRSLRIDY